MKKNKIKSDVIIISSYDSAYNWSIMFNNLIYDRKHVENLDDNNILKLIYEKYSNYQIADNLIAENFNFKLLIECENGDIRVVRRGK